ncbi:MAG: long-chain fatty acid transport protein [Pseudohongiellaceae bacterium]|jgi:long-chain fatty acid transport protein
MNIMRNMSSLRTGIALALITASPMVFATNGYFTHGLGTKNKALAGAGTATPQEAMATSVNPASAVVLGNKFESGISIFSPQRSYSATASLANGQGGAFTINPGEVDSGSEFFPIPYIARTWDLNEDTAIGLSFYGRGGMNTDYISGSATFDPDGPGPAPVMSLPGPYGAGKAGVNLMQAFTDITYSKRNGDLAWGVALVLAGQAFEGDGFASFTPYTETFAASGGTAMPTSLSNNSLDYAYGAGFKLGFIWDASDTINLALSYQSQIEMSEFDDYSDLFAQSGGFDIPASVRAGISFSLSPTSSRHYAVEHPQFNEIDSVGNPLANLFSCPTAGAGGTDLSSCLGGAKGAGFGWDDMTTHKIGYQWQPSGMEDWTMRVGFSHGKQPIRDEQVLFNMMAPGVIENHITAGFTHIMDSGKEYSFSVMYAPEKKISGPNPFDPTQQIELKMHQFEIEFGYSW